MILTVKAAHGYMITQYEVIAPVISNINIFANE